jgi:hypothetical protein
MHYHSPHSNFALRSEHVLVSIRKSCEMKFINATLRLLFGRYTRVNQQFSCCQRIAELRLPEWIDKHISNFVWA